MRSNEVERIDTSMGLYSTWDKMEIENYKFPL